MKFGPFRLLKNFMNEMDRGLSMMRGEVEPGAYVGREGHTIGCSLRDMVRPLKWLGGHLHPGGGPRWRSLRCSWQ